MWSVIFSNSRLHHWRKRETAFPVFTPRWGKRRCVFIIICIADKTPLGRKKDWTVRTWPEFWEGKLTGFLNTAELKKKKSKWKSKPARGGTEIGLLMSLMAWQPWPSLYSLSCCMKRRERGKVLTESDRKEHDLSGPCYCQKVVF